ncbi:GrpE, mitochondrial [Cystobasidiomycetes sp. EMM_F5]
MHYENLQKITQREKKQAKDYAVESLARELIGHMDILHLALRSVPADRQKKAADAPADVPDHLADLYTGVNMTSNGIEKTLLRFDVKPFDPTGEKFNPNLHEAMYMAPVPGKEPGSVLECQKKGWMLKDRVLRAAQVGVVSDSS